MIVNEMNNEQDIEIMQGEARFGLGQLVKHRLFDYRGVIVDIDPVYLGTDSWYEQVAQTRPPKDKPWYKVLVNNSLHETYVAERNLQADDSQESINHPLINSYFDDFNNGYYINNSRRTN